MAHALLVQLSVKSLDLERRNNQPQPFTTVQNSI